MQPYSKEMRRDVLEDADSGMPTAEVALKYKVSKSWVRRIKQERRELNKVAPKLTRDRTPKWQAEAEAIEKAIRPGESEIGLPGLFLFWRARLLPSRELGTTGLPR